MKKLISILLAILMMFSAVTVAFATEAAPEDTTTTETVAPEEGTTDEGETEEAPLLGEYDWLLDLPFWTVGPAFKFAKIAFKLVNVFLKVGKIFGLVDKDMGDYILEAILGMIQDAENGGEDVTEPTQAPEETTAAAVA